MPMSKSASSLGETVLVFLKFQSLKHHLHNFHHLLIFT